MTPRPDFGEMRRKALEAKQEPWRITLLADLPDTVLALLDAHDNEQAARLRQTKRADRAIEECKQAVFAIYPKYVKHGRHAPVLSDFAREVEDAIRAVATNTGVNSDSGAAFGKTDLSK